MTLVIPLGFAQVAHQFSWIADAEPMTITYGVELVGTPDPNVVALELHSDATPLATAFPTQIALVQTEVKCQLAALPAPPVIGVWAATVTGTDGRSVVPQNTAYLVHKRTATGGRGGRGRMYLPGVAEAAVSNAGVVDSGQISGYNAALATLLSDIQSGTTVDQMVLLHDSAGAFAGADPHTVISLLMDDRVATQRRRLRH